MNEDDVFRIRLSRKLNIRSNKTNRLRSTGRNSTRTSTSTSTFKSKPKLQRSVAKCSYKKNDTMGSWKAHGRYLEREKALDGSKSFDNENEEINLGKKLDDWQSQDDKYHFRFVISPENGDKMDLKNHAKSVIERIEQQVGKVEWGAVVHTNTEQPHVHIVIRGLDKNGNDLVLSKDLMKRGVRQMSSIEATKELGQRKIDPVRERKQLELDVKRPYFTRLDGRILSSQKYGVVDINNENPDNKILKYKRLEWLSNHGLAKKTGSSKWEINKDIISVLSVYKKLHSFTPDKAKFRNLNRNDFDIKYRESKSTSLIIGKYIDQLTSSSRKKYILIEVEGGKKELVLSNKVLEKSIKEKKLKNKDFIVMSRETSKNKEGEDYSYYKAAVLGSESHIKKYGINKYGNEILIKNSVNLNEEKWSNTDIGKTYKNHLDSQINDMSRETLKNKEVEDLNEESLRNTDIGKKYEDHLLARPYKTDIDLEIIKKSKDNIIDLKNEKGQNIINYDRRLEWLSKRGMAKKIGPSKWEINPKTRDILSCFETICNSFELQNENSGMSWHDFQVEYTDSKQTKNILGKVLGTVKIENGRSYMLIEDIKGGTKMVKTTKLLDEATKHYVLKKGDFIILERDQFKNQNNKNISYFDYHKLGDEKTIERQGISPYHQGKIKNTKIDLSDKKYASSGLVRAISKRKELQNERER